MTTAFMNSCWYDVLDTETLYGTPTNNQLRPQLHGAIYHPDSFVLMLSYCANLKVIRYESTSLNRIVADKLHRVIVALFDPLKSMT